MRITGCENVTRIHTDTQPCRGANGRQDVGEVFEAMADRRSLPRRRFQQQRRLQTPRPLMYLVDSLGDPPDAFLQGRLSMRPGMKNQMRHTQGFTPFQLICQGGDALVPNHSVRTG